MRRDFAVLLTLLIAVVFLAGCGGKKPPQDVPTAPADEPRVEEPAPPPPPPPPSRPEVVEVDEGGWDTEEEGEMQAGVLTAEEIREINSERVKLRTVFFGFDRQDLSPSTIATLKESAVWLEAYPDLHVVIQGHCDDRGTIEYNLALGERRARAVREYFVALGLDEARFRIVTYGEERPAKQGQDESAWSQNRRAEFLIEH